MKAEDYIKKYLSEAKTMQLATTKSNIPWICNVYFVADEDGNIYWLSEPTKRHSEDIKENPNVAISIAFKTGTPVIGLQAEGQAKQTGDLKTIKSVMVKYVKKYGLGKEFYRLASKGVNKHKIYKMTVKKYSLFDEVNFPKDSSKEWVL
jgi:uncharacterized protein YhbP (UPF0306 family)